MSDSDLPPDSHTAPQEAGDDAEQADNHSPVAAAAEDYDMNMDNDSDDGGASDNDSELSDVDEAAFADFNPTSVAIADRPIVIDEEIAKSLKASKIKRTGEAKKKEAKRDKNKKKRRREEDEDASGGEVLEGKRSRKIKSTTSGRTSTNEEDKAPVRKEKEAAAEESMTPEERRRKALDLQMDAALKNPNKRRRKKDEVDLEEAFDDEIAAVKIRMEEACRNDNTARDSGEPAIHKLIMLPEVIALLNRNTVQHSIVDPDTNFLQSVRFFLEPLNDSSLPAYNIQRDIFAALAKLPIEKDALLASGIGKVVMYYTKSKRPELQIKRQAEKLLADWMRSVLKGSDDYKLRRVEEAGSGMGNRTATSSKPPSQFGTKPETRVKELERAKFFAEGLAGPRRARLEGPSAVSYSVAPRSDTVQMPQERNKRIGAKGAEEIRKLTTKRAKREKMFEKPKSGVVSNKPGPAFDMPVKGPAFKGQE